MKTTQVILKSLAWIFILTQFVSCISDDFIDDFRDPEIRITSSIDTLEVNTSFQLNFMYLNTIGMQEQVPAVWSSSDESIASVSASGLLTANEIGTVTITVSYDDGTEVLSDQLEVNVGTSTVTSFEELAGSIVTTSSYKLEGDFILAENADGLNLSFGSDYCASAALPGLYIYLSNNKNSISGAFEIGEVSVFSGAHDLSLIHI